MRYVYLKKRFYLAHVKLRIHSITLWHHHFTLLRIVPTDFLALRLFCFNIRQHGGQVLYFNLHVDGCKFLYRRPQVVHRWFTISVYWAHPLNALSPKLLIALYFSSYLRNMMPLCPKASSNILNVALSEEIFPWLANTCVDAEKKLSQFPENGEGQKLNRIQKPLLNRKRKINENNDLNEVILGDDVKTTVVILSKNLHVKCEALNVRPRNTWVMRHIQSWKKTACIQRHHHKRRATDTNVNYDQWNECHSNVYQRQKIFYS